jgi:hypothetical protein
LYGIGLRGRDASEILVTSCYKRQKEKAVTEA